MRRSGWRHRLSAGGGIIAEWVLLWALWTIFAASAGAAELAVGAVAAAAGTLISRLARATKLATFRPHPVWLATAWRLPSMVARDSGFLVVGLIRRLSGRPAGGRLFELSLDAAGGDPASATYRALATVFTSLPPNTYVIDVDVDRRVALVHRLVPTGASPSLVAPKWRR